MAAATGSAGHGQGPGGGHVSGHGPGYGADHAGAAAGGRPLAVPARAGRAAPLRVDAQRNLEHILRAAREVFGELGYGAPMEDVARRARVGVGTVYRRFPSKDVLVRRIAEEETARLTDQARTALGQEQEPWAALARFLRTSAASGAGRLLPPQVLRVRALPHGPAADRATGTGIPGEPGSVPGMPGVPGPAYRGMANGRGAGPRVPQQRDPAAVGHGPAGAGARPAAGASESRGIIELLGVVGQLVDRARDAGELRPDVSVADVLLIIATAAPALPDPAEHAAASGRLLEILLEGLRPRQ